MAANGSRDGLVVGGLRLDIRHQQNSVLLCVDYVLIVVSSGIINCNVLCNRVKQLSGVLFVNTKSMFDKYFGMGGN